jgi:ribosomal protein S18 acetylase RimI-like enzyme
MNATLSADLTTRGGTMADIPAAVKLFNDYSEHHLSFCGYTENMIETEWKTPKFNVEEDIRLVFNSLGDLVGHIEVWTISDLPAHPWVWGRVHPDYHGQGIGTFLMQWGEERAWRAIEQCPKDVRVAYRSGTTTSVEAPKLLFETFGMNLIRHSFRMQIELEEVPPAAVWPEGITVRSVANPAADIEHITRVDHESFRDHFGFIEQPFDDVLAQFRNWLENDDKFNDPSLWFLATDNGQAVGLALCATHDMEDREFGHVASLGVLRSHRKRGIGLALLHHAFGEYYQRGYKGVSLGVDSENLTGALGLYKKAGMHVHRKFDLYEKELRPGKEVSVQNLEAQDIRS